MTKDTYCTLPFIHSHMSAGGTFKPCCNAFGSNSKHTTRNSNYTLESWFSGPEMQQLRQDMLEGRRNDLCTRCWQDEDRGGHSIRTRMNEKFAQLASGPPAIKYLDLKLTNQCNLQCMMCSPQDSNRIGDEAQQMIQQGLPVPINYADGPTNTLIKSPSIDEINRLLPNIKVLKFTGGEPAIQPEVLTVLDTAISQGYSKQIELNLTTNATKFNRKLLDKLSEFKQVKLNISVDGYGTVYDYIRYPFKWSKWLERIDEIKQYDIKCSYTAVPQLLNIENLHLLQRELGEDLYLNNYIHPDGIWNSLDIVPKTILQYAVDNIVLNDNNKTLINYIKQLIAKGEPAYKERLNDMVTTLKTFDTIRNRCYNEYLEAQTVEFIEQSGYTVV